MRVTYAGYKYELDGSAVRVFFDLPDSHKSAQTNCPSCDGYGFHRGYCNIVKLYPEYFPASSESPAVESRVPQEKP